MPAPGASPGKVYLIGAGPGAPGLLTLDGARRLSEADVVLYDYLASETLLRHARPDAKRHCLGRHGQGKLWSQQEINQRIVEEALAGATVARLKGGDPSVFGRLAEEIAACTAAGVPFEIVPGVTTATAAGAFAGLTITDRDRSSCVAFVTGHERQGKPEDEKLDFARLASFPGTLVVYMGVTNAPEWSRRLIEGGKPAGTPVTIVRRCSLPDQTTRQGTLGELPQLLAPGRVRPPLVVVIGDVASLDESARWFANRPLFGKTVLVTRPDGDAPQRLVDLGARVLTSPAIEILPAPDPAALDAAIDRLAGYEWVVFASRNGVDHLLGRLDRRDLDARVFGAAKLAAVGPGTAERLAAWRLRADLVATDNRAEGLADALADQVGGKRLLWVRADRGRETLGERLTAAGATVDQVVAYQSRDLTAPDETIAAEIATGRVDWITATSSAIARSVGRLYGEAIADCKSPPRLAAISPLTSEALAEVGLKTAAVADPHTLDGLIDAILKVTQSTTDGCSD